MLLICITFRRGVGSGSSFMNTLNTRIEILKNTKALLYIYSLMGSLCVRMMCFMNWPNQNEFLVIQGLSVIKQKEKEKTKPNNQYQYLVFTLNMHVEISLPFLTL